MVRPSKTPIIEKVLEIHPDYKDNYKKLAKEAGCCVKTIQRYFEGLNSKVPSEKTQGHDFIPPRKDHEYTDDPDELLMSVAIRELNRPNPDPRWATILINCKKENITTKSEVLDQFKQLPTQVLVNLLSKSLQKES